MSTSVVANTTNKMKPLGQNISSEWFKASKAMKTNIRIFQFILLLGALSFSELRAQQDPMVSQYPFSAHFVNPAYAGSHPYANLTLIARRQWFGFEGAPFTSYVSFDTPVEKYNIGYGALLSHDNIGVTYRTEAAGTFAYHLKLGEKAKLAAGLRAGVTYYQARLTELIYWDQNDEVFANDIDGRVLPNFGLGMYFYTQRFYAGVSIPGLLNYEPGTILNVSSANAPFLERHYYFISGIAIPAGPNVDVKPAILIKYVANAPVQADFNLSVYLFKTIWIGGSYRTGDGVLGMVEYQATKNLRVGYAYDVAMTNMRKYNDGSHEIMIAWDFIKDEQIRYKSPRFF